MRRLGVRIVLVLLLACAAPDGEAERDGGGGPADAALACSDAACLSSAECCGAQRCLGEGEVLCGACRLTEDKCDDDRPCEAGDVCHVRPAPPCSCTGADVRRCGRPCSEVPCADDERCTEEGRCVLRTCLEGFACPEGRVCDPSRGDAYGCAFVRCEDDGSCADGRVCRPDTKECVGPGRCRLPPP